MGYNSELTRLLQHLRTQTHFPIPIDLISSRMLENSIQDTISLVPVDIDPLELRGQYVGVNGNRDGFAFYATRMDLPWRRFVQCKEMLHGFDPPEAWAGTQESIDESIIRLISQFLGGPVRESVSEEFHLPSITDQIGIYIAILALAPRSAVERIRPEYEAGEKTDYEVGLFFGIPEEVAPIVFTKFAVEFEDELLK